MNKTTERRTKLFDDAEHYGAEIIRSPGWVCAVCRTWEQTHCFGRAKPKALPGTNEIDPDANLRDDEGISEDKRSLRDSKAPWVKDGIDSRFDSQPFEAGWCVMGGNPWFGNSTLAWGPDVPPCDSYRGISVYCNGAKAGENCPLLVFLEEKTGKLYISNLQFSSWGMMKLQGGWVVSDFNCELNGYTEGGIRRKLKSDAGFLKIYQEAAEASLRGMTGAVDVDVKAALDGAAEKWDGLTVISAYRQMHDAGCTNATRLFVRADGEDLPAYGIVEGAGSSMVIVVGRHKKALTAGEWLEFVKAHYEDDRSYPFRKVSVRLNGGVAEPKAELDCSKAKAVLVM